MSINAVEVAMNMWAISDQVQKQRLMRRYLEIHGESTSNNDFVGFLVAEFGLDAHTPDAGPE